MLSLAVAILSASCESTQSWVFDNCEERAIRLYAQGMEKCDSDTLDAAAQAACARTTRAIYQSDLINCSL